MLSFIKPEKYKIIYLDLDRTLWDTYDNHFDEIHIKNMDVNSMIIEKESIIDDKKNRCTPLYYYRSLINLLKEECQYLNICSLGLEDNFNTTNMIDSFKEIYKYSCAYKALKLLNIIEEFDNIILDKHSFKEIKCNKILAEISNTNIKPNECLLIDDNPYQLYMAKKNNINIYNSRSNEFRETFA